MTSPLHLLFKEVQCWGALRDAVISRHLHLLAGQDVAVQEELTHELPPVIHVQVAVVTQGLVEPAARRHDVLHTLHEKMTHVCQVGHVLHVGLRGGKDQKTPSASGQ